MPGAGQPLHRAGARARQRAEAAGIFPSVMFAGEVRRGTSRSVAVRRLGELLRHRRLLRRGVDGSAIRGGHLGRRGALDRSEEHTSELQSQSNLVCRLLLEKKKKIE